RVRERARVRIPADDVRDPGAPSREGNRRADEARPDDRERRDVERRPRAGRTGHARLGARLLLHHVEDRREEIADAAAREWAAVRGDELLHELGLARRVDRGRAGLLLVVADARDELEPAVERREELAVDGRD